MGKGILVLAVALLASSFAFSAPASTGNPVKLESFGNIPLAFTENSGQLDGNVKFAVRGSGCSMFFTPQGTTFLLAAAFGCPPALSLPN